MKLIVGLGNPGAEYTRTRHNAGFMVVDRLQARHASGAVAKARFKSVTCEAMVSGEKCLFMKPTTFMNRSGEAVAEAIGFYKINPVDELLVIVDDLYLATGAVRLRPGGGTGGHNGLTDIQRALGRDDYPRLRVGVGMLPSGGKPQHIDQADYVLSRFTGEEETLLAGAVDKAVSGVESWAGKGLAHAMNSVNASEAPPRKPRASGPGSDAPQQAERPTNRIEKQNPDQGAPAPKQ